ncbi:MAG: CPBP family intramembrane metalloprotease [Chlamydiales bacterium]|nr:CPBP family intramembrane metalloprotease [Chlamydiales bacterium]
MEVVDLRQATGSLLLASLLVLIVFFIALRAGYFALQPLGKKPPVTVRQTFGIFFTYLSLGFLILPLTNALLFHFFSQDAAISRQEWLGWAQIASLFIVFFCLTGYCFLIRAEARSYIFWGEEKPTAPRTFKSILMGIVSFVVSYPFVFWMGTFTSLIALLIWGEAKVEQVAVEQLKMTMGRPLMFGLMVFLVVVLVPFMEELLFRGFLQSMLKRYMGRISSLFITASIFALVHFSPGQGTGNFQLIASLFVLSIFLGFIYERERTLWAPIALHSVFNGFTVLLIVLSD